MGPVSGHPGILSREALELPTNAELYLSSDKVWDWQFSAFCRDCAGHLFCAGRQTPCPLSSEANFRERVAVYSLALCYVLVLISAYKPPEPSFKRSLPAAEILRTGEQGRSVGEKGRAHLSLACLMLTLCWLGILPFSHCF